MLQKLTADKKSSTRICTLYQEKRMTLHFQNQNTLQQLPKKLPILQRLSKLPSASKKLPGLTEQFFVIPESWNFQKRAKFEASKKNRTSRTETHGEEYFTAGQRRSSPFVEVLLKCFKGGGRPVFEERQHRSTANRDKTKLFVESEFLNRRYRVPAANDAVPGGIRN